MAKTLDCEGRPVEATTPAELVRLWCAGCREVVDGVPVPTDPTDLTGFTTAEAPAPAAPEQPAPAPADATTDQTESEPQA